MSITEAEIDAFGRFAKEQLHRSAALSLPQLLANWVAAREAEEVVGDIRHGLADIEAGKGRPVAEVFQDVRRKLRSAE